MEGMIRPLATVVGFILWMFGGVFAVAYLALFVLWGDWIFFGGLIVALAIAGLGLWMMVSAYRGRER